MMTRDPGASSEPMNLLVLVRLHAKARDRCRVAALRRAREAAYAAWRARRPWRWLPSGSGRLGLLGGRLRARGFARWGRAWAETFTTRWVDEFRRSSPVAPDPSDLPWFLIVAPAASQGEVDRVLFELERAPAVLRALRDPADELCAAVTRRVLEDRTSWEAQRITERVRTEVARGRLPWSPSSFQYGPALPGGDR